MMSARMVLPSNMPGTQLRDARSGNGHAGSAWEFLTGEGLVLYARALGFDPDELMRCLVPELWDR